MNEPATHEELVQRASEAIDAVAGDTSVDESELILSLVRLGDALDSHIGTLCGDEEEEGFGDGEHDEDWDDEEDSETGS